AEMEGLGLETDGMLASTAALREEIMALSGVDIMKSKDSFKSTFQILDELAAKWNDLTDIQRDSITELIAGKKQGNIISALIANFETARKATDAAVNSTGSALKEQEAYEQGIQYSLDRLEASFQTFANHVLDSDFLKGIVDLGNGVINVLDTLASKLGSLGTIGLGAGLFASVKNVGSPKMFGLKIVLNIPTVC
ncbi:MAG: phage tail tape measure protein, partial [Acetatifactor sp.]|nr:phage tail tape measure protein [Acetatifactor sp.]